MNIKIKLIGVQQTLDYMKYLIMKFFKNFIIITILVLIFDLLINLILPEKLKKKLEQQKITPLNQKDFTMI